MKKILLGVSLFIALIVIAYWIGVVYWIPSWANRGLFGDMFGALNAIFSGIALIGVVLAVYLQQVQLTLQKDESNENINLMKTQLQQMQETFKLQYQPVLQLNFTKAFIHQPRVFSTPGEGISALSRYSFNFAVINVSDTPATDIIVSSRLCSKSESAQEELRTADKHFRVVSNQKEVDGNLMFAPGKPYVTLLEALRDEDASRVPLLQVVTVYKNLVGAAFYVSEGFHILKGDKDDNTLGVWEKEINSFSDKYKTEMRELNVQKKDISEWRKSFEELKEKFAATTNVAEEVAVHVVPIPGAYKIKLLTDTEYDEFMKQVGFGRLTFSHTQCVTKEKEV